MVGEGVLIEVPSEGSPIGGWRGRAGPGGIEAALGATERRGAPTTDIDPAPWRADMLDTGPNVEGSVGAPSALHATCRLQLHAGFTFDDAIGILDVLQALGIDMVYTSPTFRAVPGSTHGYDIVDYEQVNPEIGGEAGHARFSRALANRGMTRMIDLVPNHMAMGPLNRWWWDVLENGRSSAYAAWFDVDWSTAAVDRILLPVLGKPYGEALDAGEILVQRQGASFAVHGADHQAPLDPATLGAVLDRAARASGSDLLAFLADGFASLPPITEVRRRHRHKEVLKDLLARLLSEAPEVASAVDAEVDALNADPGNLHALLELQHHRLAFWRVGRQELDYRRFFDIASLVGLRMEDPEVFDATHALVLRHVRAGQVHALRVDHPDGLRDPESYLRRLRGEAPGAVIVVEKILEPGESLPATWPVEGTTGYDFLNAALGLWIDPEGEAPLTALYQEFTGCTQAWPEVVRACKRLVMREGLGSELNRLTEFFVAVCNAHRAQRDHARRDVARAVRAVVAAFPVYRTYVAPGGVSAADRAVIEAAVEAARSDTPEVDPALFAFLREVLLLEHPGPTELAFTLSFQQVTGPVMAKGVEDTAFYNFHRFVALNEVGGDPGRFGLAPRDFHDWVARHSHPWGLRALSTHDTKRSEDVRARLAVLSEIPDAWRAMVTALAARLGTATLPDRNFQYHLFQALVGAWPLPLERALAFAVKAAREAKCATSWASPDPTYEAAIHAFLTSLYADGNALAAIESLVEQIRKPGQTNALAQVVLQLTVPGRPDRYQGSEIWDFSLVDPDNRRPVDWSARRRLLSELSDLTPEAVAARSDEGLPKLWVLRQVLHLRRRRHAAMAGAYRPLMAEGARAAHCVAFTRGDGEIVVIVPRLVTRLGDGWGDTALTLPRGRFVDCVGGRSVSGRVFLDEVLRPLPVAVLERCGST